jgi:ABC-type phosphate transport system substrate-binding protein
MRGHARQWLGWLALGGLLAFARVSCAASSQMAVITAPDAPQLTFDQNTLRNIYLKRIFVDGRGQRLTPVNLPSGAALREAFAHTILRMDDGQLQDYWDKQYFQGVSPPYVLASPAAVVQFVAKTPGAIGYVAACQVDASVHVVMTVTLPFKSGEELPACQEHRASP